MHALRKEISSNPPFPPDPAAAPDAPAAYMITDLGVLPDESPLLPVALNDAGHLALHGAIVPGEPESWKVRGFLQKDGQRSHAGIPQGRPPLTGLGATGLLCGTAALRFGGERAWASHLGLFGADFWPQADSFCAGVNASGMVTGHLVAPGNGAPVGKRAFTVSRTGQLRYILPPFGDSTTPTAINDAGAVLLNNEPHGPGSDLTQTWVWHEGRFLLVENIGGGSTWGAALTPEGRVAGYALDRFGGRHAIFWSLGRTYDLNPGRDWESEAQSANDSCTVVGRLLDLRGDYHAFRWTPGEGMRRLGELAAYAEGWVLEEAVAVNAGGQIAGLGRLDGRRRGFLLTPAG
jgi:hypothetical protein